MELKDKVIVVTGGGRGLGRAMALELASQGAKLALADLSQEDLDTTVGLCMEQGVEARAYVCNVANEDEVEQMFKSVVADFGTLSGLVNNAGITRDGLFLKVDRETGKVAKKMSMDQWNLVMDVNLTGTFLCAREAAAQMIDLGVEGCIINISSISRSGNMGQTNYTATKAGVEAMAVTWAKELARYKIRAASIAPGYIGTEMVMSMKPEALDKIAAGIPAKRLGTPAEIAKTVTFILENDYISGRCFEVDGGLRI
ncbi:MULTISPECIES: SDR family oxidoreductase [unclassified Neptuniibacter]|jgi:3-oxoacyl-[acyl-carrier protein] reductase|uniref:SDR family oxidoreductase n=1 Tax=unclassified Neptuniibacter TaxID=2630693 RepID=UPI000C36DB2C|nr:MULTISPECIES: SDR family oxidoreductase [unclassified Neptuniibacter]MAY41142.1 3-oxoacyl-ACP reductase [Oceanospirillaceae bacterium]|tara:strand:+ start:6952 stop:7719 length:768 start_codon:yes stop_codon:yes gene_type:complete